MTTGEVSAQWEKTRLQPGNALWLVMRDSHHSVIATRLSLIALLLYYPLRDAFISRGLFSGRNFDAEGFLAHARKISNTLRTVVFATPTELSPLPARIAGVHQGIKGTIRGHSAIRLGADRYSASDPIHLQRVAITVTLMHKYIFEHMVSGTALTPQQATEYSDGLSATLGYAMGDYTFPSVLQMEEMYGLVVSQLVDPIHEIPNIDRILRAIFNSQAFTTSIIPREVLIALLPQQIITYARDMLGIHVAARSEIPGLVANARIVHCDRLAAAAPDQVYGTTIWERLSTGARLVTEPPLRRQ